MARSLELRDSRREILKPEARGAVRTAPERARFPSFFIVFRSFFLRFSLCLQPFGGPQGHLWASCGLRSGHVMPSPWDVARDSASSTDRYVGAEAPKAVEEA